MSNRSGRRIGIVLVLALLLSMVPMQVFGTAKVAKPGKATISSISAAKASSKTNEGTVTLKWKKVSNATGYQIYVKHFTDEKWRRVKTVGKVTKTTFKAYGGRNSVKIRAIRKSGSTTVKGKFSASKKVFVNSPLTLEQYFKLDKEGFKKLKKEMAEEDVKLTVSKNSFIMAYDLAGEDLTEAQAKDPEFVEILEDGLKDSSDDMISTKKDLRNATGVSGIKVVVKFTYNGKKILSKSYS